MTTNKDMQRDSRPSLWQTASDSAAVVFEPLSRGRSTPPKPIWAACADSARASMRLFFWPLIMLWGFLGWKGSAFIALCMLLFAGLLSVTFPDYTAPSVWPLAYLGGFILWLVCLLLVLYQTKKAERNEPSWLAAMAVLVGTVALLSMTVLVPRTAPDQAKLEGQLDSLAKSLETVGKDLEGAKGRLAAAESGLSQTRSDLQTLRADLAEAKKAIPDKAVLLATVAKETKDAVSAALASVSDKLDSISKAINDETTARKADAATANATAEDLKKQYAALKESVATTKNELADLRAAVDKLGHGENSMGQRPTGAWDLTEVSNPDPEGPISLHRGDVSFTFDVDRLIVAIHDKENGDGAILLSFALDLDQDPSRINMHFRHELHDKPFDAKRLDDLLKSRPFLKPFMRPDLAGIYRRTGDSLQLCVGDLVGESPLRPRELKPGGDAKGIVFKLDRAARN